MTNKIVTVEHFMSGDVLGILTIDDENTGRLKVYSCVGDLLHTQNDFESIEAVTHEAEVYMMDVKHSKFIIMA